MAKEEAAAIITGASSGIRRTTAIALAKVGNKVELAARRDKGIPFR
jgi:NADP-dependent 3-hydroxy acid dehydrogenase YdfG